MAQDPEVPVIIKKIVKGHGHGHHGGAWKIAYADFVTAMMAFFMLLWLLGSTTKEQKNGIAKYFAPTTASMDSSGAGGVMGGSSLETDGAQGQGSVMLENTKPPETSSSSPSEDSAQSEVEEMIAAREEERFRVAQEELQTVIDNIPELRDFQEHLIVDITPDGMRIQIIDSEERSMFENSTANLLPHARLILGQVADIVNGMPNRIKVSGHTDSSPFSRADGYSNWELSADRGNSARRHLALNRVPQERFYEVTGKAGTEPLFPENPRGAGNRRISIVLMREAPVLPPGYLQ